MPRRSFRELFAEAQRADAYWDEWAISDFTEELSRVMETRGLGRSALARKIDVSPAYVTKVFRGDANFTLKSMTKLSRAVDGVLRLHIAPMNSYTIWFDVVDGARNDVIPSSNQNAYITVPGTVIQMPGTAIPGAHAAIADSRSVARG